MTGSRLSGTLRGGPRWVPPSRNRSGRPPQLRGEVPRWLWRGWRPGGGRGAPKTRYGRLRSEARYKDARKYNFGGCHPRQSRLIRPTSPARECGAGAGEGGTARDGPGLVEAL